MEQEGKNLKLLDSYIECMKKVFNDTVNKNDDPNVVPQEDFLNHKSSVPAKLELPPSFEEILEALKQDGMIQEHLLPMANYARRSWT
ncbi:hypothetical protein R1flu_009055 [Riccia fluitans]|uniref:Reverse transcriptase domain-containing protein n=1 Tax=Riccia fluitans TaxID=41844 RepID=A0ABD1Z166_9MARC